MIISNTFTPFFGFVEDVNDPEKLGRVKVRVTGYHSENKGVLPTDDLIWFMCLVNNSESDGGVGTNPKYNAGSLVFGYFLDNQLQNGFVVGSFNGSPNDENDINRLARNEEIDQTIVQSKKDGIRTGVEKTSGQWDEPETPYNATYPNNKVTESNSGHISECDDTEGAERLHVYHRSGSFYEVHPDGSQVVKIVKDDYSVVMGDDFICIEGNVSKYIGGNDDLVVKGNQDVTVAGTRTHDVEGKDTLRAPQIQLGEDGAVEQSVLGKQLEDFFNDVLKPYIDSHQHIDSLGNITTPPVEPLILNQTARGGSAWSRRNTNS